MSSVFYPYNYLNYNTLNRPSTFTNTCFSPNCPQPLPYANNLKTPEQDVFVKMLTDRYNIGLKRYIQSREPSRFDNLDNLPIYNSNMGPLPSNYMNYNFK